jgi:alkanesulfonate monooxygenase SsuD/methylene tetrahydromethanopterin reductase-like flavin-dependent oxidoreductase (luciferase family)
LKVSLQLIPEQPAADLLTAARVADELGYYACYSADEIYHKDAWLLLGAAASVTEQLRLGPCVAPMLLRDPTYVAGAMGGPRSMELAGEIADGLHTACAYSTEALGFAADAVSRGARAAGRSLDQLDIGGSLLGAVAPEADVARRAARTLAAFYLPSMPAALLARHGIESEDVAAVNEAFAAGDVGRALELEGLPDLPGQVRLFGEEVLPRL